MKFLGNIKDRVFGLDVLRAFAILLVVYGHGIILVPPGLAPYYKMIYPLIDGVSIFFVLSGYLIGNILLKIIQKSEFNLKDLFNFWIRRWFRTLPNYFFILAILILIALYKHNLFSSGFNWTYLFFLQNFGWIHPGFFSEAWSLCIEEWFYLLFPLSCFFIFKFLKDKKKAILYSALFFIIVPLVLRLFFYFFDIGLTARDANFKNVTIFRLDGLMYGIIGAYIASYRKELWAKYKNICLIIGLAMIVGITIWVRHQETSAYMAIYRYNLDAIATLLILPFLSQIKSIKYKKIAFFFTFISVISYSMYLTNLSIVLFFLISKTTELLGLDKISHFMSLINYFLFWFYTISLSYLIYRFYELPMTGLRDKIKFFKRKTETININNTEPNPS